MHKNIKLSFCYVISTNLVVSPKVTLAGFYTCYAASVFFAVLFIIKMRGLFRGFHQLFQIFTIFKDYLTTLFLEKMKNNNKILLKSHISVF